MAGLDAVREAIEDAESLGNAAGYTAWMSAAATIALTKDRQSFLPDSVFRSLLMRCLREAESEGLRADWAERDRVERERKDLILNRKFRRTFEDLMGYDPVMSVDEPAAYVGTLSVDDGDAEERLEVWLEDNGFRRNGVAYLKYRERDGQKEYEQGNWAYRREVDAEKQLHVRLFDGDSPETVDIYAHREPSITQGKQHFGRPDYRQGVCEMQQALSGWDGEGIHFKRRDSLPGSEGPKTYNCEGVSPLLDR